MAAIETTFLVIGGGIAGVSCVETLKFLCPNEKIVLLTESSIIKTVTNLVPLGKAICRFDIEECDAATSLTGNIEIVIGRLEFVDSQRKEIRTSTKQSIKYKLMCLCTGARPKLIVQAADNPYVLGIRDTESVIEFQKRIKNSTKIVLVGNGGIASEIVYELKGIHIDWVIKDKFISQTFVDPGAAEFFQSRITEKTHGAADGDDKKKHGATIKRWRYTEEGDKSTIGAALGPDWHTHFDLIGGGREKRLPDSVTIHKNTEVASLALNAQSDFPLRVNLTTNNESIDCDFLVSATGVCPTINFDMDEPFKLGPDNGIFVDEQMRTSIDAIYAAGDVCYAGWKAAEHWFQMRLWTQARQMGSMAARSMATTFTTPNEPIYQDFCFEIFGHVTQLFGYQVVLLGKYNGQGYGQNYEALIRMTRDKEYIKYVLVDGKLQGAILIGETGLEETSENLILNQLDVSSYGDDLLNPDIDIEDYFD